MFGADFVMAEVMSKWPVVESVRVLLSATVIDTDRLESNESLLPNMF